MCNVTKNRLPFLLIIFILFLLFFNHSTFASELTLSWDKPDDDRVAGYKIIYGESGTDFQSMHKKIIDSPNVTSILITGLDGGQLIGFTVKSIDSVSNESDFSEILYHFVVSDSDIDGDGDTSDDNSSAEIIIDNSDPDTSWDGSWKISAGENAYGDTSIYSKDSGDTYTFEKQLTGYYEVSLWWTYYPSRCTNVNVDIYDDDYLVVSLEVDQQSDGGQWNILGEYEFNGTARVVIRSSGDCSTSVDGVRFVRVPFFTGEI